MPRHDLLALTEDDLASMTNRGTVKRARRELESGQAPHRFVEEDDGLIVVEWPDDISCTFPAGKSIHDAECSSGSVGISRHIVRSVFAYQAAQLAPVGTDQPDGQPVDPEEESGDGAGSVAQETISYDHVAASRQIWDPGTITDEELLKAYRKLTVDRARKRFEQGVLVELTRGVKPVARFLDEGFTIRFLVPGDLRYVQADCDESQIPSRVPLAVWAFRALPTDRLAGLLSLQQAEPSTPQELIQDLHTQIETLIRDGLAGVPSVWSNRLERLEQSLRVEGLAWPAELIADLRHQHHMYVEHDARFSPHEVVHLVGEILARARAIVNKTTSVPQPLIRGSRADRPIAVAGGRMIGVGMGVRVHRRHATLSAYLQDADSGSIVTVERTFADPEPASDPTPLQNDPVPEPRPFAKLATETMTRGLTIGKLATHQLLIKSGKRTPSGVLTLPRGTGNLTANPQTFAWENLKPPFAAEGFDQLRQQLEAIPPSYLRPRRRAENLHMIRVQGIESVEFDVASQRLVATVRDSLNATARISHPFYARGQEGFQALLDTLEHRGSDVRFLTGLIRSTGNQLVVEPTLFVIEDGSQRIAINPWIPDPSTDKLKGEDSVDSKSLSDPEVSPISECLTRIRDGLADEILTGVTLIDDQPWRELAELGPRIGFTRLSEPILALVDRLDRRGESVRQDDGPVIRLILQLCLLMRVASD